MTVIADLNSARNFCWKILLISIIFFALLSTQATAASFDCKKAATWVEKAVCANPELSKLDEEMAKRGTRGQIFTLDISIRV